MDPATSFRNARSFLLDRREAYQAAYDGFQWPALERFNWALDWFDPYAAGNTRTALHILDEPAGEVRLTFAGLRERSARVVNALRARGAARGDRLDRGAVRSVVTDGAGAGKLDMAGGGFMRTIVGGPRERVPFEEMYRASDVFVPGGETRE